ncbi:HAMP domain-containing histidine kinase [Paenibacillus psychroresistens]|uniref:histidine kinase n=1 Tax=Paenibacillus psychroresistens TaxID=1778678 RepID=A0A6B8RQG4_9BACL|nr:ATP-binding protein [Paenibacillus psychroresistens]QGQ97785.1 HAMP domain-containing histidine kinase [Paenibacillus psychroresistens]
MSKFRVRLTLIFIILLGLSMLVAGIFTAKLSENKYIVFLEDSTLHEIAVIQAVTDLHKVGSEQELTAYYDEQAKKLKSTLQARITFISKAGKVLGDSDHEPSSMDNHLNRAEIAEAVKSGSGSEMRLSDTLNEQMLYVAVAVKDDNSQIGFIRMAMTLETVDHSVRQLWVLLLLGLSVLFIIAALISYRIAHNLTRPLEKITRVAHQITHMNYRSRVTIRKKDEIGLLGEAINTMADSLQLQMNRIQEDESRLKSVLENMMSGVVMIDRDGRIVLMNRSAEDFLGFTAEELLGKKYDEAKQQFELTKLIRECIESCEHIRDEMIFYFPEERILEVNVTPMSQSDEEWAGVLIVLHNITAVRRLERMRSEFVANVSHELKTPITAVKGFAETLLAGALDDKEIAKSFLQIIFDESERLNRLIGDILELSKIESKRIPLQFSPVEMRSLVERTLHMMRPEAEKKHISLEMHVEEDIYIEADEDRLGQILINLLSNGISYTPDGGKVKVKIEALHSPTDRDNEYERIRLTISDSGIGIPKKDLPRIFERFYRVDKARSRISGGTGLGLSIVKHLVELHKGTIQVESEVGIGTKFLIDLPVIY